MTAKTLTECTTDREGNDIREGDLVFIDSGSGEAYGIICRTEIYRVYVRLLDAPDDYVWAHVADVTFAERL